MKPSSADLTADYRSNAERRSAPKAGAFEFRGLAHDAPEAVIIVGDSGAIEYVNPAAEQLFGHKAEQLVGRHISVVSRTALAPSPIVAEAPTDESAQSEFIYSFLKNLDFFSFLSTANLHGIARQCSIESLPHGGLVACEGEQASACFIVVEGRVSMAKSSENGNQLVVELLYPGDIFNIVEALDEELASLSGRAQKGTRVVRLPKKALFALLNQHPEFYQLFVRDSSRRLRAAYGMMRAIAHDRVESRIAAALFELAERPSACLQSEDGVKITRQEIADLTGTSVETAIRITRGFEEQGILELSKRGAIRILSRADLRHHASA